MLIGSDLMEKLAGFAREVSEREGCRLYDVEFTGGAHGRVLRVYIDKEEGSVSIDDCSNVSRGLNLLLDVEDVIPGGRYELEVSSPGLERRLTQPWHFEKAVGQKVKVRLREAQPMQDGSGAVKSVSGVLQNMEGNQILIRDQKSEWRIELAQIERAQVIFEMPAASQKKGNKKR